jgi:hypothetical protein
MQRAKIALATGSKELFYQMVSDSHWVESVVKSNPDLLSMTVSIILCGLAASCRKSLQSVADCRGCRKLPNCAEFRRELS